MSYLQLRLTQWAKTAGSLHRDDIVFSKSSLLELQTLRGSGAGSGSVRRLLSFLSSKEAVDRFATSSRATSYRAAVVPPLLCRLGIAEGEASIAWLGAQATFKADADAAVIAISDDEGAAESASADAGRLDALNRVLWPVPSMFKPLHLEGRFELVHPAIGVKLVFSRDMRQPVPQNCLTLIEMWSLGKLLRPSMDTCALCLSEEADEPDGRPVAARKCALCMISFHVSCFEHALSEVSDLITGTAHPHDVRTPTTWLANAVCPWCRMLSGIMTRR